MTHPNTLRKSGRGQVCTVPSHGFWDGMSPFKSRNCALDPVAEDNIDRVYTLYCDLHQNDL